jgi:hypothetical protein
MAGGSSGSCSICLASLVDVHRRRNTDDERTLNLVIETISSQRTFLLLSLEIGGVFDILYKVQKRRMMHHVHFMPLSLVIANPTVLLPNARLRPGSSRFLRKTK